MSRRYIYLGMPGYGNATHAAGRAFWRACADDTRYRRDKNEPQRDVCLHEYAEGSLLASNFNTLWANCLNRVRTGEKIEYFAMQHDDIGAEDFWLDRLIDELEIHDLDVLGVVSPIKDRHGMTSIALAREDDDWLVKCRLSMQEIFRLPMTFTSEDVGYRLLLNTGLWVCRFREQWARKVHFKVDDRIIIDKKTGEYVRQTMPEDWRFSRSCHELGLKIGCTRKIRLMHRGTSDFPNMYPWGERAFDDNLDETIVPERKTLIDFPWEVDGWLLAEEGEALAKLAQGKRVLEIGSYCGKSTICMAQTALHVDAVDPHDGRIRKVVECNTADTLPALYDNLTTYGLRDKVRVCRCTSEQLEDIYDDCGPYGLVLIDGCHKYQSVVKDIETATRLLAPGGVIAFHDYRKCEGQFNGGWDEGVNRAVDELIANGGELLSIHASLAVVKPPAAIPLEV